MSKLKTFFSKSRWYLVVATILFLGLVIRNFLLTKSDRVLTYTVTRGTMVDTVSATSTYQVAMQKPVFSTANGVIDQTFVTNGDQVNQNDPLMRIISTATITQKAEAKVIYAKALEAYNTAKQNKLSLQSQLEQSRRAILEAEAAVENMEYNLDSGASNPTTKREYTQEEKEAIYSLVTSARSSFAAVENQYKDSNQSISANWANVESAKLAYDATQDTTLYAPAAGRVVNLLKSPGDEVNADNRPILIIANSQNPSLVVSVNEIYIPKIKPGQPVSVVFDALQDKTFSGSVDEIETIGSSLNGVVDYQVKIILADISTEVKPGMTATVTIETFKKESVLSVPSSGVFEHNGSAHVLVKSKGKSVPTEVSTGVSTADKTEITSGLTGGELIIISPEEIERYGQL